MKKKILLFLLINSSISIAQNKKEQIELLNIRVDSLNLVLDSERNISNQTIKNLNTDISAFQKQNDSIKVLLENSRDMVVKKESEYDNLKVNFKIIKDSLSTIHQKLDGLLTIQSKFDSLIKSQPTEQMNNNSDKAIVSSFVSKFYSSLELTLELNQQLEDVKFNMSSFNSCIDVNSKYSQKRISNLTGDYNKMYYIGLLSIDSVNLSKNLIEVTTTVEYEIYEVGNFHNVEKLLININKGHLTLNRWEDIRVKSMELGEYDGLENFKENDFYYRIGSLNKK